VLDEFRSDTSDIFVETIGMGLSSGVRRSVTCTRDMLPDPLNKAERMSPRLAQFSLSAIQSAFHEAE
jgi:hypothetical protein